MRRKPAPIPPTPAARRRCDAAELALYERACSSDLQCSDAAYGKPPQMTAAAQLLIANPQADAQIECAKVWAASTADVIQRLRLVRTAAPLGAVRRIAASMKRIQDCHAALVESMRGLATQLAVRSVTKFNPTADTGPAIADALLGVIMGLRAFDPWRGFRLSTYIHRSITTQLYRAHHERRQEIEFGWTEAVDDNAVAPEIALIEPIEPADRVFIDRWLARLRDDRDRDIVIRRFGLGLIRPQTLDEIAEAHKISKERVRQRLLDIFPHTATNKRGRRPSKGRSA